MAEPPPTAMMQGAFFSETAAMPLATFSMGGSGTTSVNTSKAMPARVSRSVTSLIMPEETTKGSETMKTRS